MSYSSPACCRSHPDEKVASVSLPLKPEITAPIAVAGTLLIVLGSFYALIGIKIQWYALAALVHLRNADSINLRVLVPVGVSFLINIAVAVRRAPLKSFRKTDPHLGTDRLRLETTAR